ncbi:MAG: ferritin-like domain-containing protein [Candidatus Omnitrophica bacterium]|nr:ferritin-like domain-containing protein [Candidatus Omnitrophota bacterium]
MNNTHYLEKWLRDAYAMEKTAIEILEKQVNQMNDYPEARRRISQHLEETKWQAQKVEDCLKILETSPSALKDTMGKISGTMSALMNSMSEDETLKNFISSCAFENMEVASYRSLVAAAQECGEDQIRLICGQILQQEEEMAQWCTDHIQPATMDFLAHHGVVA